MTYFISQLLIPRATLLLYASSIRLCLTFKECSWECKSTPITNEHAKRDKHTQTCVSHRFNILPFSFFVFCSFNLAPQELLYRICRWYHIHAYIARWEVHAWVHRRLFFAVMRGVDQFVLSDGDLLYCCHLSLQLSARCASPCCLFANCLIHLKSLTHEWWWFFITTRITIRRAIASCP